MMDDALRDYLTKYYPKIISTSTPIECGNGWFPIILWTLRFLQSYVDEITERSKKEPTKYSLVTNPEILRCKVEGGLLQIDHKGGDVKTDGFIRSMEYISGNICERSTAIMGNVYVTTTSETGDTTGHVINEQFMDGTESDYYHIDNDELQALIKEKIRNGDLLQQLEFAF
jgi:hypothetical protein